MLDKSQIGKPDKKESLTCELCNLKYEPNETSNCCDAHIIQDTDICSDCKEHCEAESPDWDNIDETGRCISCFEEWGEEWTDRL
jgi:hypothetical protein